VFFLLLRLDCPDRVRQYLSRTQCLRFEDMHINNRIGVMRWARKSPMHAAATEVDAAVFYRGLTAFHRLRLRVLSSSDGSPLPNGWNHKSVENEFIERAPPALVASYRQF